MAAHTVVKGQFKTAYLQHSVQLDVGVNYPAEVGDVVYLNSDGKLVAYEATSSVEVGSAMIIAQSDMTMSAIDANGTYGHVPVEVGDYRYSKAVAATTGTNKKKVSLYVVTDLMDAVLTTESRTWG